MRYFVFVFTNMAAMTSRENLLFIRMFYSFERVSIECRKTKTTVIALAN